MCIAVLPTHLPLYHSLYQLRHCYLTLSNLPLFLFFTNLINNNYIYLIFFEYQRFWFFWLWFVQLYCRNKVTKFVKANIDTLILQGLNITRKDFFLVKRYVFRTDYLISQQVPNPVDVKKIVTNKVTNLRSQVQLRIPLLNILWPVILLLLGTYY